MTDIHTQTLSYRAGDFEMVGYLAHDPGAGPRPGVLIVHEWWGLTDYLRGRARQMAEQGYCALAVDMYGGGRTAADPGEAGELMNGVLGDITAAQARFTAARDALAAHAGCDGTRMLAMGYCFGGAMVLHMARIGMDLKAVASFHGALGSFHAPAPGEVKARILVCHGADDVLVPDADVTAFKAEMDAAGAHYDFQAYAGALHGFSNPDATANGEKYGLPLAYNETVDRESFDAMRSLFADAV